ncbi:MAG: glycosyltransferase [Candidatus Bathyarchaeia archaeon]
MPNNEDIIFICDPLISEYGPLRPAILIAKKVKEKGRKATVISTVISVKIQEKLNSLGIQTVNLQRKPFLKKNESIVWLEEWVREAIFSANSRGIENFDGVILNFSNTICLPAHVWYVQGPPTVTLDNMKKHLPLHYKLINLTLLPFLKIFDKRFIRKTANCSKKVVANSKYTASTYHKFGLQVQDVIYPPVDCEKFKPKTAKPSEDFVLTYFGKETIFELIKQVLDCGIKVKAFGGKLSMIPKKIQEHPNLSFLGRVDDETLIDLYSNAFFTLYPFADEPFGYIPIESLACGTPVLTFNKQGPKETIVNGETGWLANDNYEFLKIAFQIWKKGYPKTFRKNCRQAVLRFDVNRIVKDWIKLLEVSKGKF